VAIGIKRVVVTSGTYTSDGSSSSQSTISLPNGELSLFLNVTAAVAPGSLKVYPEWTDDNGTTWYTGEGEQFDFVYTNVPVALVKNFPVHSDKYRVSYDLIGTSYTFGVNSFGALL